LGVAGVDGRSDQHRLSRKWDAHALNGDEQEDGQVPIGGEQRWKIQS